MREDGVVGKQVLGRDALDSRRRDRPKLRWKEVAERVLRDGGAESMLGKFVQPTPQEDGINWSH